MSNRASKHAPRAITYTLELTSVPHWILPLLENIGRSVRFSPSVMMNESTMRYIPSSQLTVMIEDGLLDWWDSGELPNGKTEWWTKLPLVAQSQKRTGVQTGQERDVLIIRRMGLHGVVPGIRLHGELTCAEVDGFALDIFFAGEKVNRYSLFKALAVDAVGVMMDQRKKYFQHLTEAEVRGLSAVFATRVKERSMTLVEAYRIAGKMLYDYSRGCGWVKLDTRQRERFRTNLHWLKQEEIDVLRREWNHSGVGDYTRRSASDV